jgi:L-aspartate oxidase
MADHAYDVVVIGSGAAGLTAALNLADTHKVVVLAKGGLSEGSTAHAQGGIAAVLEEGDTFESHIDDTMVAGAGLNRRETVEFVVENAPAAIERLAALGVPFNPGEVARWHLTREGGHSHRRIVHVDDATGWAVQQALEKAAAAHPNITLVPNMAAIDLVTGRHGERYSGDGHVWGVYAVNRASGRVELFTGRATILATGGAGRCYLYSTAPRGATGDGIAMAWRAGCRVSNMEFNQFHPTCLYNLEVKNFLITEAMRGEGGQLKLPGTGHRFMPDFDPREELAPRDIVARAIDHEIKRLGLDYVHLDISHKPADFVTGHFPTIHARLLELGIDITKEPIPVVPAQHYTCGGVLVDLDGRTDVPGLYAAGEVTQSPPIRCSNASFSAMRPRTTSSSIGRTCPRLRRSAPGTKAASPIRTRRSSSSIIGARSGASCGTSSASSAPPSAWNALSIASPCCGRRWPNITATSA